MPSKSRERASARDAARAALAATAEPDTPARAEPLAAPAPRTRTPRPPAARPASQPQSKANGPSARVASDQPPGTILANGGEVCTDAIVRYRNCTDCNYGFGKLQLRPICQSANACTKRQDANEAKGLPRNGRPADASPAAEAAVTNPVPTGAPDSPGGAKPVSNPGSDSAADASEGPAVAPAPKPAGKKPAGKAGDAGKEVAVRGVPESAASLAAAVAAATGGAAASG
jgi:hypothetical protein